jgi:hypothetical protein
MKNKSIESEKIFTEDGLTFSEVIRQEYSGNNCIISAGFVDGSNKPPVDTIYLRLEKDNVEPTILLLRPDEAQAISWITSGVVWSHLMEQKVGE